MSCECSADWRLEAIDLETGVRVAYLQFVSFDFEEILNEPGTGSIIVRVENTNVGDVFPHLRAIAFTRIAGEDATPESPVCEFIGMVDQVVPDSGGTLRIGLLSIEAYLNSRIVVSDYDALLDQAQYCDALVGLGSSDGIPLTSSYTTTGTNLDQAILAADDKPILAAIIEILNADNGPDYTRSHQYVAGAWTTDLHFLAEAGSDRGNLNAQQGLIGYSMTIDGSTHFNWLRGRGETDVITADTLATSPYPRFDKGIQWSDLTSSTILNRRINGELDRNFDPSILPDVTIARLALAARYRIGDRLTLSMDYGALHYVGVGRVMRRAWSVAEGSPTLCTLSLTPYGDTAATLILAAPTTEEGCC